MRRLTRDQVGLQDLMVELILELIIETTGRMHLAFLTGERHREGCQMAAHLRY